MTWRIVGTATRGTSHERTSTRCQDACRFEVAEVEEGEVALLAVSDGAGSARASHNGSLVAVSAALEHLRERIETDGSARLDRDALCDATAHARACVFAKAEELGVPAHDVACTLLVAVLTESASFVAHVGDGAVVCDAGAGLEALSWPDQGEYANVTHFLTQDDALERIRYATAGRARRVALLSDGLQHIALRYDILAPFEGFFEPFFAHLETSDSSDAEITGQLERYLDSAAVTSRTDDDKTLVLAVRRLVREPLADDALAQDGLPQSGLEVS